MGIARLIRRTAPLIVVGLAGAAAARRRAQRIRQAQLTPGPFPPPVARAEPVVEPEPEPEPPANEEPEPAEATSVTEIVDDLLAPGEEGERIEDATVVEGSVEKDEPESAL